MNIKRDKKRPLRLGERAVFLLLGLAMFTGGCQAGYHRVPSAYELPAFRDLVVASDELGLQEVLVHTPDDQGGLNIGVHDTGWAGSPRVIVFVHGLMADHTTWNYTAGALRGDERLLFVDLPGCGASEMPAPWGGANGAWSLGGMSDRIASAIEGSLGDDLATSEITLVGHSLGGTIALQIASDPALRARHQTLIERVDSLVLLAPAGPEVVINPPLALLQVERLNAAEVELAQVTGLLKHVATAITVEGYADPDRATRESVDMLIRALSRDLRAHQQMIRETIPRRGTKPDWVYTQRLRRNYRAIDVPCVIVWGDQDDVLSKATGYMLADDLPNSRLVILEQTKHSIALERPCEVAAIIEDMVPPADAIARPALSKDVR